MKENQPNQLTVEQKEHKLYKIVVAIAQAICYERRVYRSLDDVENELKKVGLKDEAGLCRILRKQMEDHNRKLEAQNTRLGNLPYNSKWKKSTLFNGMDIDYGRVLKLINEKPELDWYEIYKQYIRKY